MKGTVYMMPCPIAEDALGSIAPDSTAILYKLDTFVVERLRTARRYISKANHPIAIDDMTFFEYDKHDPYQGLKEFLQLLLEGRDIGVLSEAGCPGIADPGKNVVTFAHEHNIKVVPLVGPSSILLGLMASGFNGQNFTFHGYLPNKNKELQLRLKTIESDLNRTGTTQIFMEAPYRNKFMIESCIVSMQPDTLLCVATDINSESEYIRTLPLHKWKKIDLDQFHKRPTMFLIGR